jgi:DNA-binding CsgD family transcriptional regulator
MVSGNRVPQVALEAIEAAFEDPSSPAFQTNLVTAIGAALPGTLVSLTVRDRKTGTLSSGALAGADEGVIEPYLSHFDGVNPYVPVILDGPVGVPIDGESVMPFSVLRTTEFYNDWAAGLGYVETGTAIVVRMGEGRIATLAINSAYDQRSTVLHPSLTLLQSLVAPFSRAMSGDLRGLVRLPELKFIDILPQPSFVLDLGGAFLHHNERGRDILISATLLRLSRNGQIVLHDTAAQTQLEAVLMDMARRRFLATADPILAHAAEGGHRYLLKLFPFSAPRIGEGTVRGGYAFTNLRVLLTVTDLQALPEVSAALLLKVFRLSRAEAAVVVGLTRGSSLEEYAAANGVSVLTARNQLRSAAQKMGVSRQAEVVALVTRLANVTESL